MLCVHYLNYKYGKMLPGNWDLLCLAQISRGRIGTIKMYHVDLCCLPYALSSLQYQKIYTRVIRTNRARKTACANTVFL